MKVNSKVYKGIEYVQLSDLPREQQLLIVESFNEDSLIKIQVENNILTECIQYKEYELWFDNIFHQPHSSSVVKTPNVSTPSMLLALDKA